MGRHFKPAEDGGASAASIMNDPFEHTYSEDIALEAYRKLSSRRAMILPENMRAVINVGKILRPEKLNKNIIYGKNLYDA